MKALKKKIFPSILVGLSSTPVYLSIFSASEAAQADTSFELLMGAVLEGDYSEAKNLLLNRRFNLDRPDTEGKTLLAGAVLAASVPLVNLLLAEGTTLDQIFFFDGKSLSALALAGLLGRFQISMDLIMADLSYSRLTVEAKLAEDLGLTHLLLLIRRYLLVSFMMKIPRLSATRRPGFWAFNEIRVKSDPILRKRVLTAWKEYRTPAHLQNCPADAEPIEIESIVEVFPTQYDTDQHDL